MKCCSYYFNCKILKIMIMLCIFVGVNAFMVNNMIANSERIFVAILEMFLFSYSLKPIGPAEAKAYSSFKSSSKSDSPSRIDCTNLSNKSLSMRPAAKW